MEYSALCEAIIHFGKQQLLRIFRESKINYPVKKRAFQVLIFV